MSAPSTPSLEIERYELSEPRRYTFELERRDFMRLFGGGLLVLVTAGDALAQESGRPRPQGRGDTPDLAAWLHIDEAGLVHVCTGKVEIGQNIRTSLSQTVADELRVPIESVTLLMGDTDKTPFDQGTFGSQTTPRMAPQLARAAATAREMLIDQAAARWQADRSTLTARDGRIIAGGGQSVSYAELTKGQALTGTIPASPAVDPRDKWLVRGTPAKKIGGREFVTGAHQYTPDVARPGLVYGRVIHPDGFGGTLVSVDDARARTMSGVTVVRDGDFLGVVAPTDRAATRAAGAVQTTWNVPAGQPSSDTIYEYLKKNPERGSEPPAVSALAMPEGARAFEASYRIPYIAHTPLEPRAAVAEWQDGKLTVWTGTQRPFGVRTELAEAFRLPEDRVRVIVPDMGSGYGGKHTGEVAIEAARLAKAANRPVKIVWTRAEEFTWAYFRPAGVIDIKSGVDANGRIVSWAFDNWNSGGSGLQTPYDIPSKMQLFHASKSPLRQGSYRALAATANHYAREMHMDEMAHALGVDAVEFRMRHLKDDRLRAVLDAVAQKIGWPKPSAPGRALGIACGTEKAGYVATAVEASRGSGAVPCKLERIVIAFECGAIVNPDGLKNQVEGSVVQALGGALFEAIDFADGRIRNATLEQYRVPRFRDVPVIETILLDRRDIPSAGAGESSLIAVAPAIGSAVRTFGKIDTALPIRLVL
ncbi:MAG TPA: molybdopterin cofactor-binding domain-containing protein [Vicinamibacterales bacterium]|nr:molybdopterin cofactor-binding domain-containing protein [Vicinamibacterales bacterium]